MPLNLARFSFDSNEVVVWEDDLLVGVLNDVSLFDERIQCAVLSSKIRQASKRIKSDIVGRIWIQLRIISNCKYGSDFEQTRIESR
jgi:hypothetical protein